MLRHKSTTAVYNHWLQARDGARAPSRSAIHPAAIARALGSTALIHDPDGDAYRFQLAGTRLCSIFGRELAGHAISSVVATHDRRTMNQGITAVIQEQVVFISTMTAIARSGRTVELEAVFLPIADSDTLALGAIEPLVVPVWLGAEPVIALELCDIRILDVDRELFSLQNRPAISLPPRHNVRTAPARPALSVIDGRGFRPTNAKPTELRVYDGGKAEPAR